MLIMLLLIMMLLGGRRLKCEVESKQSPPPCCNTGVKNFFYRWSNVQRPKGQIHHESAFRLPSVGDMGVIWLSPSYV